MLKEYREILREVIKLAVIENKELKEVTSFHIGDGIEERFQKLKNREKSQLEEFLLQQNMDSIKVIQTVMYVGRDQSNDELEENPELTPERIYDRKSKELDKSGWNSKGIEIRHICEKAPLANYLKRGIKILKIND